MHSAPHRNNSDFQLRHFIAGSCHTADAAWNLLYEQRLDIIVKREHTKAKILRRRAYWLDLEEQRKNIQTAQDELRYEADLLEFNASENILELAQIQPNIQLLRVNVTQTSQRIMTISQIKNVDIRRGWPATLVIEIGRAHV